MTLSLLWHGLNQELISLLELTLGTLKFTTLSTVALSGTLAGTRVASAPLHGVRMSSALAAAIVISCSVTCERRTSTSASLLVIDRRFVVSSGLSMTSN